jgi:hypothetical protein
MSWNFFTKNSGSWVEINKSDITIYFVSENGDYYLVGQNEDEYLITQGQESGWGNLNKNSSSWNFINKN